MFTINFSTFNITYSNLNIFTVNSIYCVLDCATLITCHLLLLLVTTLLSICASTLHTQSFHTHNPHRSAAHVWSHTLWGLAFRASVLIAPLEQTCNFFCFTVQGCVLTIKIQNTEQTLFPKNVDILTLFIRCNFAVSNLQPLKIL